MDCISKYSRYPRPQIAKRTWPNNEIKHAPVWCSVDLRDGNQALTEPMSVAEKTEFYKLLLKLGFKEMEVGFPSASQVEYDFIRKLIDEKMVPEDVTLQVISPCREELIDKSIDALEGAKRVIIHLYMPLSELQRRVVFKMTPEEVKEIVLKAVDKVKERSRTFAGELILEYSPESFTGAEPEVALDICNAVIERWDPKGDEKVIINLPATMELSTPNVYADLVEWMNEGLARRENVVLSIHTHNDRCTGTAASELGLLAGAERIEGTLFGNGERTGNVDLLTLAYNMMSQGIDPELDLSNIKEIQEVYERCSKLNVAPRHPYAGELVFAAFSGSHQDAINKGIHAMKEKGSVKWEVPYLVIDPADIGRAYEQIVRINSQSGKGGVAFVMETTYGFKMPKGMYREFGAIIQNLAEGKGELPPEIILQAFKDNYIEKKSPFHFRKLLTEERHVNEQDVQACVQLTYEYNGVERVRDAVGNGPIDAVMQIIRPESGMNLKVLDYSEHALGLGSNAQAAAYVHLLDSDTGVTTFGVGISSNITRASIRAMFSALNRLIEKKESF